MDGAEMGLPDAVAQAWLSLQRAVRSAQLYDGNHALVRRHAAEAARWLAAGLDGTDLAVVHVAGDALLVGDVRLPIGADAVVQRLSADGVRELHFRRPFDTDAAAGFAATLAPYANAEVAPAESVFERLRWRPLAGLTLVAQPRHVALVGEGLGSSGAGWRERVLAASGHGSGDPLEPAWDGRGGRIPWPLPVDVRAMRGLDRELEEPDVSLGRIGTLVGWSWDALPPLGADAALEAVAAFLEAHRIEEAAALLAGLRDAGAEGTTLHAGLVEFGSEDRLLTLRQDLDTGRIDEEGLDLWMRALPGACGVAIARFAAGLPEGRVRESASFVVRQRGMAEPALLFRAIAQEAPAVAAFVIDCADSLPGPERDRAMRAAASRPELPLQLRGLRALFASADPDTAQRMISAASARDRELRHLGLSWVAEHRAEAAYRTLEDQARPAFFSSLTLPERLLYCRALGASGGPRAAALALRSLGANWAYGDVEKALPWVVCLAASGCKEAEQPLRILLTKAPAALQATVASAWTLWESQQP